MPTREYRCLAHGEFEDTDPICPSGCSGSMVKQEIRTAPALRRSAPGGGSRMSRIDGMLAETARDFGLRDLKNDGKARVSVAQALQKGGDMNTPRWEADVPRAAPGFSERGDAKQYQLPANFTPTQVPKIKLPKPRPQIAGRYRG